jgi:hypothetical protein
LYKRSSTENSVYTFLCTWEVVFDKLLFLIIFSPLCYSLIKYGALQNATHVHCAHENIVEHVNSVMGYNYLKLGSVDLETNFCQRWLHLVFKIVRTPLNKKLLYVLIYFRIQTDWSYPDEVFSCCPKPVWTNAWIVLQNRSRSFPSTLFSINPLNSKLNPICHLLTLLGARHILHVSRIRVNYFWTIWCSQSELLWASLNISKNKYLGSTLSRMYGSGQNNVLQFSVSQWYKILGTPSFGEEVNPSVPCRRFAACKDS